MKKTTHYIAFLFYVFYIKNSYASVTMKDIKANFDPDYIFYSIAPRGGALSSPKALEAFKTETLPAIFQTRYRNYLQMLSQGVRDEEFPGQPVISAEKIEKILPAPKVFINPKISRAEEAMAAKKIKETEKVLFEQRQQHLSLQQLSLGKQESKKSQNISIGYQAPVALKKDPSTNDAPQTEQKNTVEEQKSRVQQVIVPSPLLSNLQAPPPLTLTGGLAPPPPLTLTGELAPPPPLTLTGGLASPPSLALGGLAPPPPLTLTGGLAPPPHL